MKKFVFVVFFILVAGAGVVFFFLARQKGVVLDPARVEAQAAAMWPGARPPSGMKGVLALRPEEDIEIAIFAPSLDKVKPENLSAQDLRIVLARPKIEGEPDLAEIKAKIAAARDRKDLEMETAREEVAALEVGGQPYPFIRADVRHRENGAELREEITILVQEKKPTVILLLGPRATYNDALRDEFLAALQAPVNTKELPERFQPPDPGDKPKLPPEPSELKPPRPARPARPALPRPPGP